MSVHVESATANVESKKALVCRERSPEERNATRADPEANRYGSRGHEGIRAVVRAVMVGAIWREYWPSAPEKF